MKKENKEWKKISGNDYITTYTMQVPGGRLYRVLSNNSSGDISVTMCFVPDEPKQEVSLATKIATAAPVSAPEYKKTGEIFEGKTRGEDLRILLGYVWAEGNQQRVFPSEHFDELINEYIESWRFCEE